MPDNVENERILSLYRQMLTIRRTEEQIARSYQAGLIPGACHTYVGEEAIAAGVCAHLRGEDTIFSTPPGPRTRARQGRSHTRTHRGTLRQVHGVRAGAGRQHAPVLPRNRADGHQRHRGPLHPSGAGAAYTFKLLETDRVSVAFFGDGGVSNGAFTKA